MISALYETHFRNIGAMLKNYWVLREKEADPAWNNDLVTFEKAAAALMDDSMAEIKVLTEYFGQTKNIRRAIESAKSSLVNAIGNNELIDALSDDLKYAGSSRVANVLKFLAIDMAKTDDKSPAETVKANVVTATAPRSFFSGAGKGTCSALSSLTQANVTQAFVLECISAATEGAEVWKLTGSVWGAHSATVTTGVAYTAQNSESQDMFGLTVTAGATAFEVGDQFAFGVTSDEGARFQTFFVENFKVGLPSAAGADATLLDSWAGGTDDGGTGTGS